MRSHCDNVGGEELNRPRVGFSWGGGQDGDWDEELLKGYAKNPVQRPRKQVTRGKLFYLYRETKRQGGVRQPTYSKKRELALKYKDTRCLFRVALHQGGVEAPNFRGVGGGRVCGGT